MSLRILPVVVAALVTGCLARVEPSDEPPASGESATDAMPEVSVDARDPETCALPSPGVPAGGSVTVRVINKTSETLPAYSDAQGKPLWLRIAGRPLNAYGGSFCCSGDHNDPFARSEVVPPGGSGQYAWTGAHMASSGCLYVAFAPAGRYRATACLGGSSPFGGYDDAGAAARCVDVELELGAAGTLVEVTIGG